MNPEPLARILSSEEELVPSSGFLASVMDRVGEEAVAPPPIPFPWKRAVPGLLLVAAILIFGFAVPGWHLLHELGPVTLPKVYLPAAKIRYAGTAGWVALALGLSWICSVIARRMARSSSGLL
jgi:hypothetical protein